MSRDAAGPQRSPRRGAVIATCVVVAVVVVVVGAGVAWSLRPTASAPTPTVAATTPPPPPVSPTPTAVETGPPEDDTVYSLDGLPTVDVFAVVPALPVDDNPTGAFTGVTAHARTAAIPLFAAPSTAPVAALPQTADFDGTTLPVIEQQSHWLRVLVPGREAVPSSGGNPGQLTGWVRLQDVELGAAPATIDVDLEARTIDIVQPDGSRERVADDFGSGAEGTPTPQGRSFVMLVRPAPSLEYTDGYPLVYLGVQSPTLDAFGGDVVAVTAFHYHDERSGAVSNGCLRVSADTVQRLAMLPEGTGVLIH